MTEMTIQEKVKNIFAFLSIMFGDDWEAMKILMNKPPNYIIEKFERYVLSTRPESDWGLHLGLRNTVFNRYCEKYDLPITFEI